MILLIQPKLNRNTPHLPLPNEAIPRLVIHLKLSHITHPLLLAWKTTQLETLILLILYLLLKSIYLLKLLMVTCTLPTIYMQVPAETLMTTIPSPSRTLTRTPWATHPFDQTLTNIYSLRRSPTCFLLLNQRSMKSLKSLLMKSLKSLSVMNTMMPYLLLATMPYLLFAIIRVPHLSLPYLHLYLHRQYRLLLNILPMSTLLVRIMIHPLHMTHAQLPLNLSLLSAHAFLVHLSFQAQLVWLIFHD
mmetsp:Transcript_24708/g.29746  ORF Transcript_24708/g.29746 Transcript_24708/m.29746 type:complete len:246 (+) Transcript_24708:773-1510(+)